jgi:hypothetical protein
VVDGGLAQLLELRQLLLVRLRVLLAHGSGEATAYCEVPRST